MVEILHDRVCRMATDAMVGFVENEEANIGHFHEAMYQCIQKHLVRTDDDVNISQCFVPCALFTPPIDPVVTGKQNALK